MTYPFIPNELTITRDLDGISLKAIETHFKLYEGYVKKTNEIREKMASADKELANATYSEIGELKRQESFATDGMKLHAVYFGILGGNGEPVGKIADMIIRDFGSIEVWKEDMIAAGLSVLKKVFANAFRTAWSSDCLSFSILLIHSSDNSGCI